MLRLRRSARPGSGGVAGVLAAGVVAAAVLSGCGSGHHHQAAARPVHPATRAVDPVTQRLDHLRALLPAGFSAPGSAVAAPAPAQLSVAPAAGLKPSAVHVAPIPSHQALLSVLAGTINQPLPLAVHSLFVSSSDPRPGSAFTVAAAHLGTAPHHAALFILQGPDFRAERLVAEGDGVAAGVVTLPAHMTAGTWYFLVEDLSGVTATGTTDSGTVIVDVGQLTIDR